MLIFGASVTMFLNSYTDTLLRAIAVDAARHLALADQDVNSSSVQLDAKLKRLLPNISVSKSSDRGELATVRLSYRPMLSFLNLSSREVSIRVAAPIEK